MSNEQAVEEVEAESGTYALVKLDEAGDAPAALQESDIAEIDGVQAVFPPYSPLGDGRLTVGAGTEDAQAFRFDQLPDDMAVAFDFFADEPRVVINNAAVRVDRCDAPESVRVGLTPADEEYNFGSESSETPDE